MYRVFDMGLFLVRGRRPSAIAKFHKTEDNSEGESGVVIRSSK